MNAKVEKRQQPELGSAVGWIFLGGLAGLVALIACWYEPPSPAAAEAGYRLAAESVLEDRDLLFTQADVERLRSSRWPAHMQLPLSTAAEDRLRFPFPAIYPTVLAPFVALAPERGPRLLNALLILALAGLAGRFLARRSGSDGTWLVVAVVFGSALFAYAFTALPTLLLALLTWMALSLLVPQQKDPLAATAMHLPDVYPEERPVESPRNGFLRAAVAGGLLAVVAAHHPLCWLLLPAAIPLCGPGRQRRGLLGMGFGALVVTALLWLAPGSAAATADLGVREDAQAVRRGEQVEVHWVTQPAPALDLGARGGLVRWNALYGLLGKHIGLLPYALPLVLLLAGWRRTGRGWLLAAAACGLLAAWLLSPYDIGGLPAAIGNRLFVPFYVALWFVPERLPSRWLSVSMLIAGGALLWPLWTSSGAPLAAVADGELPVRLARDRLFYETTQRGLPERAEIVTHDLLIRANGRGVETGGRRGHLLLHPRGVAELVVAAPRELSALELTFGEGAETQLDVSGGRVGDTVFHGSGDVTFEVVLDPSRVRHSGWWSMEPQHFYSLTVQMEGIERAVSFSVQAPEQGYAIKSEPRRREGPA